MTVGQVEVPLSYTDDLYRLRAHIQFVIELVENGSFAKSPELEGEKTEPADEVDHALAELRELSQNGWAGLEGSKIDWKQAKSLQQYELACQVGLFISGKKLEGESEGDDEENGRKSSLRFDSLFEDL